MRNRYNDEGYRNEDWRDRGMGGGERWGEERGGGRSMMGTDWGRDEGRGREGHRDFGTPQYPNRDYGREWGMRDMGREMRGSEDRNEPGRSFREEWDQGWPNRESNRDNDWRRTGGGGYTMGGRDYGSGRDMNRDMGREMGMGGRDWDTEEGRWMQSGGRNAEDEGRRYQQGMDRFRSMGGGSSWNERDRGMDRDRFGGQTYQMSGAAYGQQTDRGQGYHGAGQRWNQGESGYGDTNRNWGGGVQGSMHGQQGWSRNEGFGGAWGSDRQGQGSAQQQRMAGRGPKGYRRSDERIREDVIDRIVENGLDASEVEISVKEGEVTLSGTVHQRVYKHRMEDIAEQVSGVRDVHNQIRVKRQDEETERRESSVLTGDNARRQNASTQAQRS